MDQHTKDPHFAVNEILTATERLEHSEIRYRRLFETAHDCILILDALSGRVLDVNRFMLNLLQYPFEYFLGKELWEIGVLRDIEANKMAIKTLQEKGSIRYEDLPLQDKNGKLIPVEFISNVYREGDRSVIQCNIRDITERRRVEKQLEKNRELAETANRAKSAFLANMSHEIRTPMTAITGFADMILDPGQTEEGRNECVQVIRRNSAYLLELINGILDLAKIEEGKMTVEGIPCEIVELLADVVAIIRPKAAEKALRFELVVECPIPRVIPTDPTRLRQILVNLLGNAIKFTATGNVTMTVRVEGEEPDHALCVEVADSGTGMTDEQLAKLFKPFSQADESITRLFGGTGLGLTISRQLSHLMGGEIAVSSRLGIGSIFTLRIPCGSFVGSEMLTHLGEELPSAPALANTWQNIPLHGRILLAEDARDNQRLLSMHLRAGGAKVVIAENGQIAIDLISANHFDLILMDMQMPVMDGYLAVSELRRTGCTTPIVALTANAMDDDRKKCMASGCTDYLSKPVDRQVFLRTVSSYLHTPDALASANPLPSGRSRRPTRRSSAA